MQNMLQSVQLANRIYNSDIEPEHDTDFYCNCAIHQYKRRKINRLGVQDLWSKAVMYPGQHYHFLRHQLLCGHNLTPSFPSE
jgi:hypothetical protein